MPSSTVENYLKELYLASSREGASPMIGTGAIAAAVGVTPGTATIMIKTLAESGLVSYEPRTGAALTKRGEQLALHVVRRHRLLELFLVEIVGLDWSEVHDEAEHLEHAISEKVLDRIDEMLGRPALDPHGHPIPTACGKVASQSLTRLSHCQTGQKVRVARLDDRDPTFLRYADEHGLGIDAWVHIIASDPIAEAMTIQPQDKAILTIGQTAAEKIMVERPSSAKQKQAKNSQK